MSKTLNYIEVLTKSSKTWDAKYNSFAPEAAAKNLADFCDELGFESGTIEVASTRSSYFTVYCDDDYEEQFQIRCSDHSKPVFGSVRKVGKSGVMYKDEKEGKYFCNGISSAKKIIKDFAKAYFKNQ